jgi:hypothetical protein
LVGNSITGSLPSGFEKLTVLKSLALQELNGTIPSELGHMTSLSKWKVIGHSVPNYIDDIANRQVLLPDDLDFVIGTASLVLIHGTLTGSIPSELGLMTSLSKFKDCRHE